MATVVERELHVTYDNATQYCIAEGLELSDGSNNAFRLYMDGGTTGSAILNEDGKAVLYPSKTCSPFRGKSVMGGSRGAGSMSTELQFGGTSVHTASFTSIDTQTQTLDAIDDRALCDSTAETDIRWTIIGHYTTTAYRIHTATITLSFYQFVHSAKKGDNANGVISTNCSATTPYYKDSVTYTAELINGAEWHGWYRDAACTILASTDRSYTVAATSDLTLYASATTAEQTYSANVGVADHVEANVTPDVGVAGTLVTFGATPEAGYLFDGWYADRGYTNLVSTDNPYTVAIGEDITLYPKVSIMVFYVNVGTAEFANTSVSSNRVEYGANATFSAIITDQDYRFAGWYSDLDCTQLVSTHNPYIATISSNLTLYPSVVLKTFSVKLTKAGSESAFLSYIRSISLIAVNPELMTDADWTRFYAGNFSTISSKASYGYANSALSVTSMPSCSLSDIPARAYIGIYGTASAPDIRPMGASVRWSESAAGSTNFGESIPDKVFLPHIGEIAVIDGINRDWEIYYCYGYMHKNEAVPSAGVLSVTAEKAYSTIIDDVIFTAALESGYIFDGWYSDSDLTTLVSKDNPLVIRPMTVVTETSVVDGVTYYRYYYRLYARCIHASGGTGLYLRNGGVYSEVRVVYRKINGAYEMIDDIGAVMSADVKYIKGDG